MASSRSRSRADLVSEAERWIAKLVGAPLLRASFSYAGELRLHFGKPVAYESPQLTGRTRGEWVLALRATPWALVANGAILSRSHDEPQHALRHFEELEGRPLTETRLRHSDAALTLRFSDDTWFVVLTEPRDRATKSLDLWELLMPRDVFVVAYQDRTLATVNASARPAIARDDESG